MTTAAAKAHDRNAGPSDRFAGPAAAVPAGGDSTDLLSAVLSHVRLSGALFLRGQYAAPWAFQSPERDEVARMLVPDADRLIVFHSVRRGRVLVTAGNSTVEAAEGDVVVLPHCDPHVMGYPRLSEPVPFTSILPPQPWPGVPECRAGGDGEPTEIACGYFSCHEFLFHSFLRQLPAVFRVRPSGAAAAMLEAAIRYAIDEPSAARQGQVALMSRLPELLLIECLRLLSESAPAEAGWFAAAGDPIVSRALRLLHAGPARAWNADLLAREAATSRSVLNERFRALIGKPPMQYLGEWRMQLATDLLRTTTLKISAIAEQSGYTSDAAFSRAFHRHVGLPPTEWRERNRPAADGAAAAGAGGA